MLHLFGKYLLSIFSIRGTLLGFRGVETDRLWNQESYMQFSYQLCDPSQVAILTILSLSKEKTKGRRSGDY